MRIHVVELRVLLPTYIYTINVLVRGSTLFKSVVFMDIFSRLPKAPSTSTSGGSSTSGVGTGPMLPGARKRPSVQISSASPHKHHKAASTRTSKTSAGLQPQDMEDELDEDGCLEISTSFPEPAPYTTGNLSEPQPMMLLSQDDGKMRLHVDALKLLQSGRKRVPLVIVSIVGKARRGKSFLMNRSMLGKARQMFQVSSSSNACTKGIIIHGRPWPLQVLASERGMLSEEVSSLPDVDVVFADSEGIDATDRTDGYDNNMLTFACVISSAIIYNAHGPIDEDALSKISTIAEVGKSLLEENQDDKSTNFPSFHWCARDFALDCHDASGNEITPDEYLEFQLSDQVDQPAKKSAMRRALKSFFKKRMCHTLPRPVASEDELRHVQEMEDSDLRPQFMSALKTFRSRLFSTLEPRIVDSKSSKYLTSVDMVSLMQKFVRAINEGIVPNIQDSWQQVTQARARRAVIEATKTFEASAGSLVSPSPVDVFHTLLSACKLAHAAFCRRAADISPSGISEYESELSVDISKRVDAFLAKFDTLASEQLQAAIQVLGRDVEIASGCLFEEDESSGLERIKTKLETVVKRVSGSATAIPACSDIPLPWQAVKMSLQNFMQREHDLLGRAVACSVVVDYVPAQFRQWVSSEACAHSSSKDFEETCKKYEEEIARIQEDLDSQRRRCVTLETSVSEFESLYRESNEKLAAAQQSFESLREQLSLAASAESRAMQLEEELKAVREDETRRSEEMQLRMDQFEAAARSQIQKSVLELHGAMQRNEDLESTVSSMREELSELESVLEAERSSSEARDKAIESERTVLREQLHATREMLLEAQAKLSARVEKKHQAAIEIAEEKLKWSQLLRTTEAALARSEAEKASCERELSTVKEKLKDMSKTQALLEEARIAQGRFQGENEWLRGERKNLQDQLRDTQKELSMLRQEVREMRFAASLR